MPDKTAPAYTVLHHPTPDELAVGFARWAERFPKLFRVETCGTSRDGRPILAARVSDDRVPDEDKQVALLTSCHVARELNAGTGLLRFLRWLLGDDPAAAAIRRRQIVLAVPYTDPDGIAAGGWLSTEPETLGQYLVHENRGLYNCWGPEGVTDPDRHPESVALQGIMDRYQPDLFMDMHGLAFAEQTMWESTGVSWNGGRLRPFLHDVPRRIDEAAEKEGFLITRAEQDAGMVLTTSDIPDASPYYYLRKPGTNVTVYPYLAFHSMALILEAGFEESIVARTRAAIELGHETWRGERYPGYPVNQVGCWGSMAVAAWGTLARERRLSRCALWRKLPQLAFGIAWPEPRGSIMACCATTRAARERFRLSAGGLDGVIEACASDSRFDSEALKNLRRRNPATRFGLFPTVPADEKTAVGDDSPPRHGLVLRLLVPFGDARVTDIRLDGHPVPASDTDGFHVRHGPGTIVEIAIPPANARDFHIASCLYDSPTRRRAGFEAADWD